MKKNKLQQLNIKRLKQNQELNQEFISILTQAVLLRKKDEEILTLKLEKIQREIKDMETEISKAKQKNTNNNCKAVAIENSNAVGLETAEQVVSVSGNATFNFGHKES